MYYRIKSETIYTQPMTEDGTATAKFIGGHDKDRLWRRINRAIMENVRDNDLTLTYKDYYEHTVDEVINRVPMICNFISLRGYKKILFVGHYNAAQESWLVDPKIDRIPHTLPKSRWDKNKIVDSNILLQFIPIIRKEMGYHEWDMHVVKPTESRHRKVMHSLYQRFELDILNGGSQYKHGMTEFNVETPPDTLYDAVLFAAVPKSDSGVEFTYDDVKDVFGHLLTEDAEIIDMYYQSKDTSKYIGADAKDIGTEMTMVFSNRALWDDKFKDTTRGAMDGVEYKMLLDTIKVY